MLSHGSDTVWRPSRRAAGRLGVSRMPVREALKILEGEGHVEYQPHHGYSVTRLDLDDFTHLVHIPWDATDVNRSLYYTDVSNRYRVRAEHAGIVQAAAEAHAEELVSWPTVRAGWAWLRRRCGAGPVHPPRRPPGCAEAWAAPALRDANPWNPQRRLYGVLSMPSTP